MGGGAISGRGWKEGVDLIECDKSFKDIDTVREGVRKTRARGVDGFTDIAVTFGSEY